MDIDLSEKNALVCGSTQGIGKASAMELAQQGANIILIARNEDKLKAVVKELPVKGGQKHGYLVADFDYPERLKKLMVDFVSNTTVHILLNNIGGPTAGQAIDADESEFIKAFTKHLICNQILVKAVVPGMKSSGYGRIINIISTSVKTPIKGLGVSNTVRGAVASWSKTLSNELASFGITVNNILPGLTMTGRLDSLIKSRSRDQGKTEEEIKQQMLNTIPAGRFAQPEELANAVAFLASPAAAYINGVSMSIDGGMTPSL